MSGACMRVSSLIALTLLAAPAAEAASAREVFEQYGVLGTFAIDCRQPVSPQNHYLHFRALTDGSVQIELMVGSRQRQHAYVIDLAVARGPNLISTSMANEQQRLNLIYRVEGDWLRTMESSGEARPRIFPWLQLYWATG